MWLENLALKRRANVSTVAVVVTLDPKRIRQFIEVAKERVEGLFKPPHGSYEMKFLYDLQRQRIINIDSEAEVSLSPMETPINYIDSVLTSKPTLIVVSYIHSCRQAEALADWILAWSQDDRLYAKGSTVIVFASDENLFSQPVLRSVALHRVEPSTPEEREAILSRVAEALNEELKLGLKVTPELVMASSGLNLHETETAALESILRHRTLKREAFTSYKISILRKIGVSYLEPTRGFESVGGYSYLKDYIKNYVIKPLRNPEIARKYGIPLPRGLLLFGPPGTGKTWFCKALSRELGLPMLSLNPADFFRGIVGETEARVRQVREIVESLAPCVVFFDEVDQLFMARERQMVTDSGVSRRFQSMLLEWLGDEKRRSFIVGATNFVGDLDPAFLRPGRIDEVVVVLPPDREARREILRVHTEVVRSVPISSDVNLDQLADETYLWTGAELEKLVIQAARLAFVEEAEAVEPQHFEEAMKGFEVNVAEREKNLRRMLREAERLENINRLFLQEALRAFKRAEGEERVKSFLKQI